jgi:NAD(P)-dependent dehydrogenase (short-subunit alcohol dehydrogenase family)
MGRLDGKVAIVTGAAGGIGNAFAKGLARNGASVLAADLDIEGARTVSAEIAGEGGTDAASYHLDVTSVESAENMARIALEHFGRIDILVNTAAIYVTLERTPFPEIDLAEWARVMNVDFNGTALCSRAVLPAMKEQRSGSIVNMGSVNTHLVPEGRTHYNSAKAAVETFTRTLAREVGPFGIRVNALAPGLVRTGKAHLVSEERYERTAKERALRREMTPEDLIGPLVFLCSDDAAMITGHVLVVDGGQIFK